MKDRALCVMATGLGKTECMIELARVAKRPVLMLMGRVALVEQTARRARAAGVETAEWCGSIGTRSRAKLTVASIQSADDLDASDCGLIIIDEVHNVDMSEGRYAAFIARHPGVKVAGFTATPWRSGVPIYEEGGRDFYRGLEFGIEEGYLVPPVAKAMPDAFDARGLSIVAGDYAQGELAALVSNQAKVRAQVVDALKRLEGRSSVVWVCTNIEHAEMVYSQIPGAHIMHSKAHNTIDDFAAGRVRHMVSVMMLTEGIDVPRVDAIVLMRPTRSPTLMVQCIGRGLRPFPGKENCLVLDYGRVIASCGPVNAPYLKDPQERREKAEVIERLTTVCPACLSYVKLPAKECPDCGHEFVKERDPTKNLTAEAADVELINTRPEMFDCQHVTLNRHRTRKGDDCLRLDFQVRGKMWPVKMYGSRHPFSWKLFSSTLHQLTPFRFDSWQECYDAVDQLEDALTTPKRVEVRMEGGYEKVTRIEH